MALNVIRIDNEASTPESRAALARLARLRVPSELIPQNTTSFSSFVNAQLQQKIFDEDLFSRVIASQPLKIQPEISLEFLGASEALFKIIGEAENRFELIHHLKIELSRKQLLDLPTRFSAVINDENQQRKALATRQQHDLLAKSYSALLITALYSAHYAEPGRRRFIIDVFAKSLQARASELYMNSQRSLCKSLEFVGWAFPGDAVILQAIKSHLQAILSADSLAEVQKTALSLQMDFNEILRTSPITDLIQLLKTTGDQLTGVLPEVLFEKSPLASQTEYFFTVMETKQIQTLQETAWLRTFAAQLDERAAIRGSLVFRGENAAISDAITKLKFLRTALKSKALQQIINYSANLEDVVKNQLLPEQFLKEELEMRLHQLIDNFSSLKFDRLLEMLGALSAESRKEMLQALARGVQEREDGVVLLLKIAALEPDLKFQLCNCDLDAVADYLAGCQVQFLVSSQIQIIKEILMRQKSRMTLGDAKHVKTVFLLARLFKNFVYDGFVQQLVLLFKQRLSAEDQALVALPRAEPPQILQFTKIQFDQTQLRVGLEAARQKKGGIVDFVLSLNILEANRGKETFQYLQQLKED